MPNLSAYKSPLLGLYGTLLLFFVLLGVWLAVDLQRGYEKVLADTSQRAVQQSLVISQSFRTKVLTSDYVLRDVLGRIKETDLVFPDPDQEHAKRMTMLLKGKSDTVPDFLFMVMFDKDCVFTATTTGKNTGVKSKQELCEARKRHSGPDALVSYVPGTKSASGQSVLTLSRHVTSPAGDFQGGVLGVIELQRARSLFNLPGLDPGDSVALLDEDRVLLVRHPLLEEAIEKRATTLKIPEVLRSTGGSTSGAAQLDVDGHERLFGFSKIEGFPFFVAFGFDKAKALKEWQWRTMQLTVGYLTLLLLAFFAARSHWTTLCQRDELRSSEEHFRLLSEKLAGSTAELNEQKHVFEKLVYESTDAVLLLQEGRVIDCNEAAVRMLGCDVKTQLLDMHPSLFSPKFQPDGRPSATKANEMIGICLETGTRKFEWMHTRIDNGEPFWVEVTLTKIQLNRNFIIHVIWRDISESKALHTALIQEKEKAEQATRAKSDFLANMSHEIRTPMNAITGMAYLAMQTDLNPQQQEYITRLRSAANSLLGVLNDILDFSKIEVGKMELEAVNFNLNTLLSSVRDLVTVKAEDKNLELLFSRSPDIPVFLIGDPLRLGQILNNLVGNAIKFTEKGRIVVTVSSALQITKPDHVALMFSVADTGIGMAEGQLKRIFTPFAQADSSISRNYGGTGLGLSIVSRLLELMGSRLEVVSEPGQGSTFSFAVEFECSHFQAEQATESVKYQNETTSGGMKQLCNVKVLLVEDNKVNQIVAREMLRKFGVEVITTNNGHEAVVRISSGEMFDLVFMDIQMPILNGFEATAAIRKMKGELELPIIAMTAFAFSDERDKCLSVGMNDHIAKPIDPDNVYSVLIRWIPPGKTLSAPVVNNTSAETFPDTLPGIDVASALARVNGNNGLLRRILAEFRDTNRSTIADIRVATTARDRDHLLQITHTLKGLAGTIGATSLATTAAKFEDFVKHDDEEAVKETVRAIAYNFADSE